MSEFYQESQSKLDVIRKKASSKIFEEVNSEMVDFTGVSGVKSHWLPSENIREIYKVSNEERTLSVSFVGFYNDGIIIPDANGEGGIKYKNFNNFSVDELLLICYWTELCFSQACAEFRAKLEISQRMKVINDLFDVNNLTMDFSV